MNSLPIVPRRADIGSLFAGEAVPRLSDEAAQRIVESAGLTLKEPYSAETAASLTGSVASGILIMQYGAEPGKKSFKTAYNIFHRFIRALDSLKATRSAAPLEVRQAVQTISRWLRVEADAENGRAGQKRATRQYELRDMRIVRLYANLFGFEQLSETVEQPGTAENGSAARFILAFYAEMHDLLKVAVASSRDAASILTKVEPTWRPPTNNQVREAIQREKKAWQEWEQS